MRRGDSSRSQASPEAAIPRTVGTVIAADTSCTQGEVSKRRPRARSLDQIVETCVCYVVWPAMAAGCGVLLYWLWTDLEGGPGRSTLIVSTALLVLLIVSVVCAFGVWLELSVPFQRGASSPPIPGHPGSGEVSGRNMESALEVDRECAELFDVLKANDRIERRVLQTIRVNARIIQKAEGKTLREAEYQSICSLIDSLRTRTGAEDGMNLVISLVKRKYPHLTDMLKDYERRSGDLALRDEMRSGNDR